MLFKASAPGSLMLLGEYAVLHGHPALVCAIDKRITVKLMPRNDTQIELISALGCHQTELSQLEVVAPFKFILATLKKYQKHLKQGCTLTVESEFSDQVGLASSAAVTVATLRVVSAWLGFSYSPTQLIRYARRIIQFVQGFGSGSDVAACVLGGMVAYRMQSLIAERLTSSYPLTVVYSGNKIPTVEAVSKVTHSFSVYPRLFKRLLQCVGDCAAQGVLAAKHKDWSELGKIMNIQQGLMDAMGVNTSLLSAMTAELRADPNVLGAKISGSGLGDCVVGLGAVRNNYISQYMNQGVERVHVNIAAEGVQCEKI